jgi:hypothetical protein
VQEVVSLCDAENEIAALLQIQCNYTKSDSKFTHLMCYMRILDAECFQGNARDVMYMYHRNLQVTLFLYIPFLSHLISAIFDSASAY